jgi:hypothetical protein
MGAAERVHVGATGLCPQTRAGRGEDIDPWRTLFGTGMDVEAVLTVRLPSPSDAGAGNGCLVLPRAPLMWIILPNVLQ